MILFKKPIHPAIVMILFWCSILFVYFFGPIRLTPGMSFPGALFLFTHVILFITGSAIALILSYKKTPYRVLIVDNQQVMQQLICIFLFISVLGGLFSILGRIADLDDLSLMAISKLRTLKAQSLLHGGEAHSNVLSTLAFFMYPAGFIALVAAILQYEEISRLARLLIYVFIIIIFCVAVLAGGRSPILLLLLFVSIACYTRTTLGKPWMPHSRFLRWGSIALLLAFVVYSSIIWSVRSTESGKNTEQYLQHAAQVWGAHPKPWLLATSTRLNRPNLTFSVLGPVFYLTQNILVTEKILALPEEIPHVYGSYHIDLLAAVFRRIPESTLLLKENYETLLNTGIYGYFTGAWGALFIDFGYFSLLAAMVWGFLAGLSWGKLKNNPTLLTSIFYVFWIYSIMISFASPPFGFSNSLMVFIWFILFYLVSKLRSAFSPCICCMN